MNQIEAGHQEPRIHVAMRLVAACGADLHSFFTKIAEEMSLYTSRDLIDSKISQKMKGDVLHYTCPYLKICGYGSLLRYWRLQKGLSQQSITDKANYDLRSLQRVEKGEQEPMVTTAVKLVAAMEVQPGDFFACLWFFCLELGEYQVCFQPSGGVSAFRAFAMA